LPEVVGREDALFDPLSAEAIAARITQVLTDDNFRQQLQEHGPVQAARFSWDASAQRALAAFEEVVSQARPRPAWAAFSAERNAQRDQLISRLRRLDIQPGPNERDLQIVAQALVNNEATADRWLRGQPLPEQITWRIEGPFD